MISSGAFNYINILEKTADASWLRHSVISNNIANADTPTYKRKDVTFQSYLEEQLTGGEWMMQWQTRSLICSTAVYIRITAR